MTPVTSADLERVRLFSGLPPEALAELAGAASRRRLQDGEALFEQGHPATNLYVVERGSLVLRTTQGGRSVIVESLGPGGIVGWSAMRGHALTLSTGRAAGPVEIVAIPVEPVIALITGGHPGSRELYQRIIGLAAGHLDDAWRQLLQAGRDGVISGG
jgi:CRP/FNR family transcriptional regulator, nitrogen oxide reductase regulator